VNAGVDVSPGTGGDGGQARRAIVVGGGVTGLTAAYDLARAGVDVTVLESADRLGGKVLTVPFRGRDLEAGADAFLARHPAATELARELGLGEDLVHPATAQVWLWSRGRLRPIPSGTVLGAPTDPVALARSRVLPVRHLARALLEPGLPPRRVTGDRSVADVVGSRYGRGVVDTLVDPLLSGVYAGRVDDLSVEATAPMIAEAARSGRLTPALRRYRAGQAAAGGRPVFVTLASGLSRLTDALVWTLKGRVRVGVAATGVVRSQGGWSVVTDDGDLHADAVVLAAPAFVSARLLGEIAPASAHDLGAIRYASVAVVTLAYGASADAELPRGSGMLVPRGEGRLIKAATWVSRKWPQHTGADRLLIRASVGRIDDDRWRRLPADGLIRRVDGEVREATGITRPAEEAQLTPWERSLPQYTVGHRDRVTRIRAGLPHGIHVAGAAYDGIGVSPCVASARTAAAAVLGDLVVSGRGGGPAAPRGPARL
jgi:oxygen-dependent protoporphyrinogen oxidase